MTNRSDRALVLRDDEGNRVPERERASLEEALPDDTDGYFMPLHMGSVFYAYSLNREPPAPGYKHPVKPNESPITQSDG